jgi:tRNA(adenine34) deaminase
VIFGVRDPKAGAAGSVISLFTENRLNHQPEVQEGILAEPCGRLLKEFFKDLRNKKSEDKLL